MRRKKVWFSVFSGALFTISMVILLVGAVFLSGCAGSGPRQNGGVQYTTPSRDNVLPFPGHHRHPAVAEEDNITAHVVAYRNYSDPLSGLNRVFFAFNHYAYRYLLIPASRGYQRVTPDPVEAGVNNFFYNIKTPVYLLNHLVRFDLKKAEHNLKRFGINTTLGILGFFDPAATRYGLERAETHLEDSLAHYGAGYGVYLVLPILGPSDIRNTLSNLTEYFLNPITYLTENPTTAVVQGFDHLQEFSPQASRYLILHQKSDEPYVFFRNMYLQGVQRDAAY